MIVPIPTWEPLDQPSRLNLQQRQSRSHLSGLPCGCDPGAGWTCAECQAEQARAAEADVREARQLMRLEGSEG